MRAEILNVCQILDRLGSRDPVSTISESPLELKIPGLESTEAVALEESLLGVVDRFQELEQKVRDHKPEAAVSNGGIEARQINRRPRERQLDTTTWTPPEEAPQEITNGTIESWYS